MARGFLLWTEDLGVLVITLLPSGQNQEGCQVLRHPLTLFPLLLPTSGKFSYIPFPFIWKIPILQSHIHRSCSFSVISGRTYHLLQRCQVQELLFCFSFYFSSRQGFSVYPSISWNLFCRPVWPQTERSKCLCLQSTLVLRTQGVHHHAWLVNYFSILNFWKLWYETDFRVLGHSLDLLQKVDFLSQKGIC